MSKAHNKQQRLNLARTLLLQSGEEGISDKELATTLGIDVSNAYRYRQELKAERVTPGRYRLIPTEEDESLARIILRVGQDNRRQQTLFRLAEKIGQLIQDELAANPEWLFECTFIPENTSSAQQNALHKGLHAAVTTILSGQTQQTSVSKLLAEGWSSTDQLECLNFIIHELASVLSMLTDNANQYAAQTFPSFQPQLAYTIIDLTDFPSFTRNVLRLARQLPPEAAEWYENGIYLPDPYQSFGNVLDVTNDAILTDTLRSLLDQLHRLHPIRPVIDPQGPHARELTNTPTGIFLKLKRS